MLKNSFFHNFKILTIYSTIAYVFAYLIVFLLYSLATAFIASTYDIRTMLVHNNLIFLTPDTSSLWDFDSAIYVFSAGTIFLVIVSLILLGVYRYNRYYEGFIKTVICWIVLHSVNRVMGTFIEGCIFDLYFSNIVLYWLYIDLWPMFGMVVVSVFAILFIGMKTTRMLLLSTISFSFIKKRKRYFFILSQAFKTWFYSSIIIAIIHLPSLSFSENFLSITMLLLILPSYFNYKKVKLPMFKKEEQENLDKEIEMEIEKQIELEIDKSEPNYSVPWKYIFLLTIFIILFRVILYYKIQF
jgi:hypothetical protein